MPFILSTAGKKDDPKTRRLIRSHVMLGKNKGRPRPTKRRLPPPLPWETVPAWESSESASESVEHLPAIPPNVGSSWSFIRLADDIETAVLGDILRFSSLAKHARVPLEACISFHKNDNVVVEPLASDAAYLHAAALATNIYRRQMLDSDDSRALSKISLHYPRALHLLRERISLGDETKTMSDSTIMVVLVLALHARVTGDHIAAKQHMEGALKITNLRGGLGGEDVRPMLAMEIFRSDILLAVETGSRPVFFADKCLHETFIPFPDQFSHFDPGRDQRLGSRLYPEDFPDDVNDDLLAVWGVMKKFCSLINRTVKSKRKLSEATLIKAMGSILYRLHHMGFAVDTFDEALRLGLVAFSSHVFFEPTSIDVQGTPLSSAYRACLLDSAIQEQMSPQIFLWLQIVGFIAVFDVSDHTWQKPLLQSSIERCGMRSWREVSDMMNTYVWIDIVFDKPGKDVYEMLMF